MSTYTQILYQIVWSPRDRLPVLTKAYRQELFMYIAGVFRNKKCHVYAINGIENHFHIVFYLHPSVALSDLIKDAKLASSKWIKMSGRFPNFKGWQTGYSAFTSQYGAKDVLIQYVLNQEEHHHKKSFLQELTELLDEHQVDYDPRYFP